MSSISEEGTLIKSDIDLVTKMKSGEVQDCSEGNQRSPSKELVRFFKSMM